MGVHGRFVDTTTQAVSNLGEEEFLFQQVAAVTYRELFNLDDINDMRRGL